MRGSIEESRHVKPTRRSPQEHLIMIRTIRPLRATLLAALLCGVSSVSLFAQGPGGGPEHPHHHGPPPSPLFDALDTNHDGVLSAEEIANASASLKALLKDGATELKREDLRPTPPHPDPAADPAASDRDQPRPKVPMIRPHGPPPQSDEARNDAPDQATPPTPPQPDEAAPGPQYDPSEHHHHPAPDDAMESDPRGHGPEHPHHGPPPSPIFDALDTNHDGVISAEEMDHATGALKELLKPGTTELRREDLRPMPPHHPEEGRP